MNYFKLLAVSTNASNDEIRKAYKAAVLLAHPDKGGSTQKFKEIQDAYEILKDPKKRSEYYQELKQDTKIKVAFKNFIRPIPLKEVRMPAAFPLIDGIPYIFETAPDKMDCKFRYGDIVVNAKKQTGCILGIASNGVYWKLDGQSFATLLFCPSTFGNDDFGIRIVFRADLKLKNTPKSFSSFSKPAAPRFKKPSDNYVPESLHQDPLSKTYSGNSFVGRFAESHERKTLLKKHKLQHIEHSIKKNFELENKKRQEIIKFIDKFIIDFEMGCKLFLKDTSLPIKSLLPSSNLKTFDFVGELLPSRFKTINDFTKLDGNNKKSSTPALIPLPEENFNDNCHLANSQEKSNTVENSSLTFKTFFPSPYGYKDENDILNCRASKKAIFSTIASPAPTVRI